MTRKINDIGLKHIKKWEGKSLIAYQDSAAIWTIGYGHTAKMGEPIPEKNMIITQEEALAILLKDLTLYENAIENLVSVALSDNQFACLVSFVYNIGLSAFKKSTLLKKLNRGEYSSVPKELLRWTKVMGKDLQGLINRRHAEVQLWQSECSFF